MLSSILFWLTTSALMFRVSCAHRCQRTHASINIALIHLFQRSQGRMELVLLLIVLLFKQATCMVVV